jgi:hypothetical protein
MLGARCARTPNLAAASGSLGCARQPVGFEISSEPVKLKFRSPTQIWQLFIMADFQATPPITTARRQEDDTIGWKLSKVLFQPAHFPIRPLRSPVEDGRGVLWVWSAMCCKSVSTYRSRQVTSRYVREMTLYCLFSDISSDQRAISLALDASVSRES